MYILKLEMWDLRIMLYAKVVLFQSQLSNLQSALSFTPTQSRIKPVPTVRTTVLNGIIDDSRVTYLFTKPNPLHTKRSLKQNEINLRLDINLKNLDFVIAYSVRNPILHLKLRYKIAAPSLLTQIFQ